jgi:hypothetical protein
MSRPFSIVRAIAIFSAIILSFIGVFGGIAAGVVLHEGHDPLLMLERWEIMRPLILMSACAAVVLESVLAMAKLRR